MVNNIESYENLNGFELLNKQDQVGACGALRKLLPLPAPPPAPLTLMSPTPRIMHAGHGDPHV